MGRRKSLGLGTKLKICAEDGAARGADTGDKGLG